MIESVHIFSSNFDLYHRPYRWKLVVQFAKWKTDCFNLIIFIIIFCCMSKTCVQYIEFFEFFKYIFTQFFFLFFFPLFFCNYNKFLQFFCFVSFKFFIIIFMLNFSNFNNNLMNRPLYTTLFFSPSLFIL